MRTTELDHFWGTENLAMHDCLMTEMILIPFCAVSCWKLVHCCLCFSRLGPEVLGLALAHLGISCLGLCLCLKECLDHIADDNLSIEEWCWLVVGVPARQPVRRWYRCRSVGRRQQVLCVSVLRTTTVFNHQQQHSIFIFILNTSSSSSQWWQLAHR